MLSAATTDREQAQEWLTKYAAAHVGIEGIVAKGLGQRYRGGARDWLKYRYRDTVDVIIGAVTGSLTSPERLILGLYRDGALHIVGGTSALSTGQQRLLAPLLAPAAERSPMAAGHRWRPRRLLGQQGRRSGARAARSRCRGGCRHRVRARTVATRHHVHPTSPRPAPVGHDLAAMIDWRALT